MPSGTLRRVYPIYKNIVQLGPWSGGLNAELAQEELPSNMMAILVNFIIKSTGVLRQRPQVSSQTTTQFAFPATNTNAIFCRALGSVVGTVGQIVPLIAQGTFIGGNYTVKYYLFDQVTNAWIAAFPTQTFTSLAAGYTGMPIGVLKYNNLYWTASTPSGTVPALVSITTLTGGTSTNHTGANWGFDSGGSPTIPLVGFTMLKDRMFVLDQQNIYYSAALDPTDWATTAGHGGVIQTAREDGQSTLDFCVFDNALYYFKSNSIWRLSFTNDPGVAGDAVNECIISEIGALDHEIYNNELYIANGRGLYKLVNSQFIEQSAPVRSLFRNAQIDINLATVFNGVINTVGPTYGFGLFKLGGLLLCGPLNFNATTRGNETLNDLYVGNYYLVYDFDRKIWSAWQFSANAAAGPVSGPVQKPMPQGVVASVPTKYFWIGQTLDSGALGVGILTRLQNPFSINALDLTEENTNTGPGFDVGGTGSGICQWIGGIFQTGLVTLQNKNQWKRVFNTWVKAVYNSRTFLTGASKLGYSLDEQSINPAITPEAGRITFSAGYRAHSFAVEYDSITGTAIAANAVGMPELNEVELMTMQISISEMDIQ